MEFISVIILICGIIAFFANFGVYDVQRGYRIFAIFSVIFSEFIYYSLIPEIVSVIPSIWHNLGIVGVIPILGNLLLLYFSTITAKEKKTKEKLKEEKENRSLRVNSEDLVKKFERSVQIETDELVSNNYFQKFLEHYGNMFDFIGNSVSEVIEGKWNKDFVKTDFIQFLSFLIYSRDRDFAFILNEEEEKTLLNLQKLLRKANVNITIEDLRNRISFRIFSRKLGDFKKTFPSEENLVEDYVKVYNGNYYHDDFAFIYYLKYDHFSEKKFQDILDQIKMLVDEKELRDFEEKLLDSPPERLTIYDIDLMDWKSFEILVANIYKGMGYEIELTKLSNDQGVDIIASNLRERIAIQTKCYKKPVSNKAIQEVIAGSHFYNCNKAIVITNSTFTKSALELAVKNNVVLIDREELQNLL